MTTVDEAGAGPVSAVRADGPTTAPAVAVPCVARPYADRVHVDGPCRCFYGGPAAVFLSGAARIIALG